jgi:hypothetical protein
VTDEFTSGRPDLGTDLPKKKGLPDGQTPELHTDRLETPASLQFRDQPVFFRSASTSLRCSPLKPPLLITRM